METLPSSDDDAPAINGVVAFGACFFLAIVVEVLANIPPDNDTRPFAQVFWFLVFSCAALTLLIVRNCGGPSALVSAFFVSQIVCILIAFFGGFWWFSHSEQVGYPLLFANSFVILCWTYPLVEWFFISIRNCVQGKIDPPFTVLCCLFCVLPLVSYFCVVGNRYADPVDNIRTQEMYWAGVEQRWALGAEERQEEQWRAKRRAQLEFQSEIRMKEKIHRKLFGN
jgi:hypothetical protein